MGGGGWEFSSGPQNDNDSLCAIHAALDHGINWIDTAAVYGLGHAEDIVGRAVKGRTPRPYVFSKCSVVWDGKGKTTNCLRAVSIRRELEDSLRRLNTDVIDLYQIHWPQPDEDIEEGWREMAKLKSEGKVRYIGVSNFNVKQMARAQRIAQITSLQPPYSILSRRIESEVLPFAQQNSIGVISYAPLHSGLLTGALSAEAIANLSPDDFRRGIRDFREPRLSHNLRVAETLRAIGDRHGHTVSEVAAAWVLRNPAITGTIIGVRTAQEVQEVVGAVEFRLSDAEIKEIEAVSKRSFWQRALLRGKEFWAETISREP
jgi:aryl-alcohol dehydrogenase-like predicted oxidoreductase